MKTCLPMERERSLFNTSTKKGQIIDKIPITIKYLFNKKNLIHLQIGQYMYEL